MNKKVFTISKLISPYRLLIVLLFITTRAVSTETGNLPKSDYTIAAKKTEVAGRKARPLIVPFERPGSVSQPIDNTAGRVRLMRKAASPMPLLPSADFMPDPNDYDSDGIDNNLDFDDDNDGILDIVESPGCFFSLNDWNTTPKSTAQVGISSALNSTLGDFDKLVDGVSNVDAVTFSTATPQPIQNTNVYLFTFAQPVKLTALYLKFSTANSQFGGTTKLEGSNDGITWPTALVDAVSQTPTTNTTANGNIAITNSIKYGVLTPTSFKYYRIAGSAVSGIVAQPASEVYFDISADGYQAHSFPKNSCTDDADNDGLPSHRDLDSDGDGCADAIEGGASFTDANLMNTVISGGNSGAAYNGSSNVPVTKNLGNTVDANGVPQAAGASGQTTLYSLSKLLNECADSDSDGVKDVNDVDDDNDGITDISEGAGNCPSGLTPQTALTSLSQAKGVPTGRYYFDLTADNNPNNAFQADVDNAEDGGWVLVLQYVHKGGTNPDLKIIGAGQNFPVNSTAVLGADEATSLSSWGHAGNAALNQFPDDFEMRFYGETSNHNRKIHFKTPLGTAYAKTGIGTFKTVGLNLSFTALTGNTAIHIPSQLDDGFPSKGDHALTDFPFYKYNAAHWGIKGNSNRWEVDDFPSSAGLLHTIHKVWVRSTNETKCIPADTDKDGIYNHLDLDSDGDGCADAIEGGGSFTDANLVASNMPGGNTSSNGSVYNGTSITGVTKNLGISVTSNGLPDKPGIGGGQSVQYSQSKYLNECIDSDGDTVKDIADMDDDNDGILDIAEGDCLSGITPQQAFTSLSQAKGISAGRYYFNFGKGVFQADVDDAEGGGWVLVAQYVHMGGTNPALKVLAAGDHFPVNSTAALGTDESAVSAQWGHAGNAALQQFDGDFETRFYGATNSHGRKIHFKTPLGTAYLKTGKGSFAGIATSFAGLASQSANLPANTDNTPADKGDNALTESSFFKLNLNRWGIRAEGNRWEVDTIDNESKHTIHKVWIRAATTGTRCVPVDTDGDGIFNHLDLDSDGDGCADAIEGGRAFTSDSTANSSMPGGNSGSSYNGYDDAGVIKNLGNTVDATGVPTIVGSAGQSVYLSQSKNANECTDSDGDSKKDVADIDDDNDGILDAAEAPGCYHTINEWTSAIKATASIDISSALTTTLAGFSRLLDNVAGSNAVVFSVSPTQTIENTSVYLFRFINPVQIDNLYLQFATASSQFAANTMLQGSNNGTDWTSLNSNVASTSTLTNTTVNGAITLTNSIRYQVATNAAKYEYYRITGVVGAGTISNHPASEVYFDMNTATYQPSLFPKNCSTDTDKDGIPNELDLDSDGDGCSDAREGGATYSESPSSFSNNASMPGGNNSGTKKRSSYDGYDSIGVKENLGNASVDANGVPSIAGATGQTIQYSQDKSLNDCTDSDGDTVKDIADMDDDNDGILDTDEKKSCGVGNLNFEFYDFLSTNAVGAVDAIPITGALATGLVNTFNPATLQEKHDPGDANHYGIRFTGFINIATAGDYTFYTQSDDGSKLYINDVQVVNNDGTHAAIEKSGTINLTAGVHKIRVLYSELNQAESLTVSWEGSGIAKQGLPFTVLMPCTQTETDTDGDGLPNRLDLDSDGDGCPDALEGGANFSNADLTNSSMPGGNTGASYTGTSNTAVTQNLSGTVLTSTGVPTKAGKGQVVRYAEDKTLNTCTNSDGDARNDWQDIDDDNDGILDAVEAPACHFSLNEWNTLPKQATHVRISSELTTTTGDFDRLLDNVSGANAVIFSVSPTQTIENKSVYLFTFSDTVRLNALYLQFNTATQFAGSTKLEGSNTNNNDWAPLVTIASGTVTTSTTENGAVAITHSIKYGVSTPTTAFRYYRIAGSGASDITAGPASEVYFDMNGGTYQASAFPKNSCTVDTDGDGIPNTRDWDSDGDGCSDAVEGGAGFTNADIIDNGSLSGGNSGSSYTGTSSASTAKSLSGTVAASGVPTGAGAAGQSVQYSQNKMQDECANTDGDGVGDITDIDDDNDGILDKLEQTPCSASNSGRIIPEVLPSSVSTSPNGIVNSFSNGYYIPENLNKPGLNSTSSWSSANNVVGNYVGLVLPKPSTLDSILTQGRAGAGQWVTHYRLEATKGIIANGTQGTGVTWVAIGTFVGNGDQNTIVTHQITNTDKDWTAVRIVPLTWNGHQSLRFAVAVTCTPFDIDTDGDGKPNRLDLDSDGDGCSDAKEAGANTGSDSTNFKFTGADANTNGLIDSKEEGTTGKMNFASEYQEYALDKTINKCKDSDGDLVNDFIDQDDDNDGIADITEASSCYYAHYDAHTIATVSSQLTGEDDTQSDGDIQLLHDKDPASTFNFTASQTINGSALFIIRYPTPVKLSSVTIENTTSFGTGATAKLEASVDSLLWVTASATAVSLSTTANKVFTVTTSNAFRYYRILGDGGSAITDVATTIAEISAVPVVGGYVMAEHPKKNCTVDTDGDGIIDPLDLDSDGDGCPDAIEGGANITSGQLVTSSMPGGNSGGSYNGTSNTPESRNLGNTISPTGIPTAANSGAGQTAFASKLKQLSECLDSDGDGVNDLKDIDDDNDGVLDMVEGGSGCKDGKTTTSAFTSLSQARNVIEGGVHHFDISGVKFSTFVDVNGYVMVASDNPSASAALAAVSDLVHTSRHILPGATLSVLSDIEEVRISHSGGKVDVTNNNTTVISRVKNNVTLYKGSSDNAINDSWTGVASDGLTLDVASGNTTATTSLPNAIFHSVGNHGGFQWVPASSLQHIKLAEGRIGGEFFHLWVRGNTVAPLCVGAADTDNDGITNALDLDSDGDGCPDAKEAQTSTKNGVTHASRNLKNGSSDSSSLVYSVNEAVITNPVGANGFADVLESTAESGTYTGTYQPYTDAALVHTATACTYTSGTASLSQIICEGTQPANLTVNGYTGMVTKWQYSNASDFSTGVTDIASSASMTLTSAQMGILTATRHYRAEVQYSTIKPALYSTIITITVTTGGTVSPLTQTICSGTQPASLSLSGQVGTVTKWQRSINTNFSGATDIAATAGATVLTNTTIGNLTQTTYFRALVKYETCAELPSGVVTITVDAREGGTISGTQTICSGTQPASLSLSGQVGTVTKWQRSNSADFSIATDIAATAGATVLTSTTIGNLTQTTYFRTLVSNGTCVDIASGVVTITVDARAGGTISGTQTICSGTQPASLSLSGHTGTVTKWQRSINTNFSGATDIAATAGATVLTSTTIGNLTQTTYFRTLVSNGTCVDIASGVVTITVDAREGGTISGTQTICSGTQPASLSLSGQVGTVTKWQRSINTNFSGATDIAATAGATVLTSTTIGNLTQTTYFRTLVSNGTCVDIASGVVTITVDARAGGTISGTQTICSGTQPASLSLSGQVGTVTKWQRSNSADFSVATDIAATAGATVLTSTTIGNLTQTTYFRTLATNGSCVDIASGVVTITVDARAGGTISGTQTICSGTQPASLSLSGHTGTVTKWQRSNSADFSIATDIAATAGATVLTSTTIGNLTQTTYFRTLATNGTCVDIASGVVTITVDAREGGTISGTQTICSGTQPASLSLSGHTGTVTKWQRSIIADFSVATDIAATAGATVLTSTSIGNLTQTTYFRTLVTNGTCVDIASGVVTITVDARAGGTISGTQTICSGTQPASLSLSGHTGTVTKWQRSLNTNFSGATDIAATAGATVLTSTSIGNLTQTTYFRTLVSNGTCVDIASGVVTITVDARAGGTISGTQTICSGTQPASLSLSGHVGTVTKWQRSNSADFSVATDIAATAGATVLTNTTIGNLTQTTYFRTLVTNGSCVDIASGVVTITVDARAGGTISGTQTICSGTQPASLSLSGHVGTVTKWQRSINTNFSGATDIAATAGATVLTNTTIGNLTQTTYFRTLVSNGTCVDIASGVVTITVDARAGGTISGTQTICSGTQPASLSLSGHTGTVTKWQRSNSADFSVATDIAATAGATVLTSTSIGNLTQTTYFRTLVSNGTCVDIASGVVTITVDARAGGTISGTQTICSGTQPASLSLSGQVGTVTKWQRSIIADFSIATDIAATAGATVLTNTTIGNLTQTTYFRTLVTNGACVDIASGVVTITVDARAGGTISGTQTICSGTQPASLSLSGQVGTVTKWQRSNSADFSIATDIAATAGATVLTSTTIGNLTQTTYFRTLVSNGTCVDIASGVVTITVDARAGGTISGTQTICSGTQPASLSLSGHTGTVTKWQRSNSADFSIATDIAATAGATVLTSTTIGNLTQTTYFRTLVSNGTCVDIASGVVTITVDAREGGTISGTQTICSGTQPASLSLSGHTGTVTKWQRSNSADFSVATDIAATAGSTILTSTTIGNLTQTTYFRTLVTNGSCVDIASGVVTITVDARAGGTISGTQTICSGTQPASLSLSGQVGTVTKWQRSIIAGFSVATDIAATAGATVLTSTTIGNLTQTTYFRTLVTNGTCVDIASGVVTITVDARAGGTISGTQTICSGTQPASLSLSGQVGTVTKWQRSNSADFSVATDIAATAGATVLTSTTIGNLTQTTYFRTLVSNGTCVDIASGVVTITVDARAGGTISGTQTICSGTQPASLSLSGQVGTVTKWQRSNSADFSIATDIAATAGATVLTSTTIGNLTQTTYFRTLVTNGTCVDIASGVVTITVDARAGGTISGTQTICSGTQPASLSLSGHTGTVTKWQRSNSADFSIATDIAATAGATVLTNTTIGNLTQTTYFRTLATNGTCVDIASGVVTITVDARAGGTISGTQTICSGTQPASLSLSGQVGTVTKWQRSNSPDFSVATDIAATAGATVLTSTTIGNLTQTTYFRTLATNGACVDIASGVVTITVDAREGGTISGTQTICSGTQPASLSLSGHTGTVTKWQRSNSADFSVATDIAATAGATVLTSTSIGNLTQTTYFRTLVTNGTCVDIASGVVTITVDARAGGTISGTQTICSGTQPASLSLSGHTGTVTKWQRSNSADFSIATDIAATAGATVLTSTSIGNLTQTTYFRTLVTNGSCVDIASGVVTITVDAVSAGGTILGAQTICSGNSADLTLSGRTGNVVKWQRSVDAGFGSAVDISNTSDVLMTGSLTQTTYYRAVVQGGGACPTVNSESVLITINAVSVGGAISGAQTICSGNSAADLTLSGRTGNVVRWQRSVDAGFGSAVHISNTTDVLVTGNLAQTTYYRAMVKSGVCNEVPSGVVTITINAVSVGGTISGTQTICSGTQPASLSLSGHTGTVTKWQRSINTNFSGATDIAATAGATVLTSTTIGNLTQTTYFRTLAINGACVDIASGVVTITVDAREGGTISGTQTICSGTQPASLSLSGHTGTVTKWQRSINTNFSGATDIAATAGATVLTSTTIGNLTQTTYFRTLATNGSCVDIASGVVTITVDAREGGTISGTQTICSGTQPASLSLSGQVGTVTKWQRSNSADFSVATDIAATAGATVLTSTSIGNLTQTTYFRTLATNGTCVDIASGVVTITVDAVSAGGTILGAQTICSGNSADLTLSGRTGNVVKWQRSVDAGFGSAVDISNTSDVLMTGSLTQTTYYRAVVQGGGACPTVNSESVLITINAVSVGGAISGAQTICSGNSAADLTLSGRTGNVVRWQRSVDAGFGSAVDISNTSDVLMTGSLTQTTYYRAMVKSGVCNEVPSGVVTITINAVSVGGTISGAQTICSGNSAVDLTLSGRTGNVVRWQRSVDAGFGSAVDISNTTDVLATGNLTQTTYYRAVVQGGGACPTVNSESVLITINAVSVGGTISGAQTICSGSSAVDLTLSGRTGNVVRWQRSVDAGFGSAVDISNTSDVLMTGSLTQTSYYRAMVKSGACNEVPSGVVTITINAVSVGGTISGAQTICSGNSAVDLTLSGRTGNVVKWQRSVVAGFGSAVDISNTTDVLATGNLAQTTYYRAMVKSGVCNEVPSGVVTITVTPNNTVGVASSSPTLCINTSLTNITHSTTGATGIGVATNLPAGVTASWLSNTITISGTPSESGTFSYSIALTGGCGGGTATGSITVTAAPVGGTISGGQTICSGTQPASLSLSGYTGNVVKWQHSVASDFSSGTDIPSSASATLTSGQMGTLTASRYYRAIVKNGVCTEATATVVLITVQNAITIAITPAGGAAIQSGNSQVLTASGADTYTWSPTAGLSNTTGSSVQATLTTTTMYTVIGTSSTTGCTAQATVTITVVDGGTITGDGGSHSSGSGSSSGNQVSCGSPYIPDPIKSVSGSAVAGATTSYQWQSSTIADFSSGIIYIDGATGASYTPTAAISSTTYYRRATIYSGQHYYSNVITAAVHPAVTVSVNPATATIQSGNSQLLTASGADAYTWSPATGLSSTTGSSVTASPNTTITYTITGTNSTTGCKGEATITITVQNNLNPGDVGISSSGALVRTKSFCSPAVGILIQSTDTASGGAGNYKYIWQKSTDSVKYEDVVTATDINWTVDSLPAGIWHIRRKVTSGSQVAFCPGVKVTVFDPVTITVTPAGATIQSGKTQLLTASGANTYTWSPIAGLSSTTGSSVMAAPTATTTYTVSGTNTTTGCNGKTTVTIIVQNNQKLNPGDVDIVDNSSGALVRTKSFCSLTAIPIQSTNLASGGAGDYKYIWQKSTDSVKYEDVVTATDINWTVDSLSAGIWHIRRKVTSGNLVAFCPGVKVTVFKPVQKPVISNNGSLELAKNGTVVLNSTPGAAYRWSDSSTSQSITVTVPKVGVYRVKVTDANGCTSEQSDPVTVIPPSPSVSPDSVYIVGSPDNPANIGVRITPAPGGTIRYYLQPGGGSPISVPAFPTSGGVFTYYIEEVINGAVSRRVPYTITMRTKLEVADLLKLVFDTATIRVNGNILTGFRFLLKNKTDARIDSVALIDDLSRLLPIGTLFDIVQIKASGNLVVDTAYDGKIRTNLLMPRSWLAPNTTDTVELVIKVSGVVQDWENTATMNGKTKLGRISLISSDFQNGNPPVTDIRYTTKVKMPLKIVGVPTGFSPNGDGKNDNFRIARSPGVTITLRIFNRWGALIYNSTETSADYQDTWTGEAEKQNGVVGAGLTDGTYFYIVEATETATGKVTRYSDILIIKKL